MLKICQFLRVLNPDLLQLDCDSGVPVSAYLMMFEESWNHPFAASWLAGIQIVQINALEFLESPNSDNVDASEGGVLQDTTVFPERRRAATFC